MAPGPIWTPLIPASFPSEKVEQFGLEVPMKRAGQPSEIGPSYVFLASEDSSYFTGQVLHPNGMLILFLLHWVNIILFLIGVVYLNWMESYFSFEIRFYLFLYITG